MTDHELLEAAAKAAGILTPSWYGNASYIDGMLSIWNPLEDDGDALRLAVMLYMRVTVNSDATDVYGGEHGIHVREPYYGSRYAATRRAIVRAAAEIGRTPQAAKATGRADSGDGPQKDNL